MAVHAGLQLADNGQLLLLVVRQAEHKIVTAKVAHRRTGHLAVLQQKGGKGQHQVARLRSTVQLGIQFEMLEIDGGNTPVLALVLRQKLLQLLQEVVFASDPCKRIGLRCADISFNFSSSDIVNPSLLDVFDKICHSVRQYNTILNLWK